jgi:hypothetical protein
MQPPNLCCLGFVLSVLRECGLACPSGVDLAEYHSWMSRIRDNKFDAFDIVLTRQDNELHCGLMISPLQFIHMTHGGIEIGNVLAEAQNLVGVYRIHGHIPVLPQSVRV